MKRYKYHIMFDTHKTKFLKTRHEYSKRKVLKYDGSLKAHKHNSPALHGCTVTYLLV